MSKERLVPDWQHEDWVWEHAPELTEIANLLDKVRKNTAVKQLSREELREIIVHVLT